MSTSGYLLVGLAIVAAVWDAIAVQVYGLQGSESAWFNEIGRRYPTFILCIGILVGHFFARMQMVGGQQ